jgi:HD-GYP domain-containing protein (c-di-GMP phosphodiesterase class II)
MPHDWHRSPACARVHAVATTGGAFVTEFRQEFRISVRGLELGMFVSRLDKPWLETPFPLQGFLVDSEEDLDKLKRVCSHVYVDITSGKSPDARFIELEAVDVVESARGRDELANLRKVDWVLQTDFQTELGHAEVAHDVLQKGVQEIMEDLKGGRALDIAKVRAGVEAMIDSITRNPSAYLWLKEMKRKDDYTYHHALGCSVGAASFARHLGLDRNELLEMSLGGLLFDVGKTRLPPGVLSKQQALDDAEAELMRQHVQYGLEILEKTDGITHGILEMVRTHHERHDGSGYPHGLRGVDIPVSGRILGIIDTYDALTKDRRHAPGLSPHQAVAELYKMRGTLFQAEIIEQFIQTCGIYPTGSLVELSNGRVGVVTAVHSLKRLRPSVMVLLDEHKTPLAQFHTIDLSQVTLDNNGEPLVIKAGLPPRAFGIDPVELFLD